MIAKIMSGSGFGGTERYVMDYDNRNGKQVNSLESYGLDVRVKRDGTVEHDPNMAARSFWQQADLNPRVSKPVGHTVLSFKPEDKDKLTDDLMRQIAHEYMEKMGIRDTQYHIVAHEEKRNPHMHIVWNRVDCNGRRYNDSHERERSTRACRQITEKYGLTMGEHKSISRSRINSPVETQRYRICRAVFFAMHQTSSIRQMQEYLKAAKIDMQLKTHSSTGEIYGVTFSRNGVTLKGSQVDRRLSAANIQVYYAARWGRYPLRPGASAQEVDKAIEKVGKALSAYHKAYPMKNGATILDVARNSLARQVLHTMAKSHDFRDLERILARSGVSMEVHKGGRKGHIDDIFFTKGDFSFNSRDMNPMLAPEYMDEFFHERIANHDLRHCDELSDDKAINLVADMLDSIMSQDISTGQDEKRNLEARQHKMTIYR